jgi:heme A synthase
MPNPAERFPRPHRRLRQLAVAAAGATVLLIAVGALVRATGSGEGCPGWPRCFGRWVPPFTHHPGVPLTNALIEYSHRLTASAVFVLVALLAVAAWRRYRGVRRVIVPATLSLGLWLFQAVLGGLVVRYGLTPWLVTAHLAVANLFLGTLAYTAAAAFSVNVAPAGPFDRMTRLIWLAAAAVLGLIVVGALVRGERAGLAFTDWPLMGGRVVPALGALRPTLMFVHRALALLAAGLIASLALLAWRRRGTRGPAAALVLGAAGLYLVQVLIGAANVWTRLAVGAVVAHVAVSSLIWAALVAGAVASRACWTSKGAAEATVGDGPRSRAAAPVGAPKGDHEGAVSR